MSEYKLNIPDDELDDFIRDLRSIKGNDRVLLRAGLAASELKSQTPLPTKHGAIVQTNRGTYVLADPKSSTEHWLELTSNGGYDWVDEPEGGNRTVLFEGL